MGADFEGAATGWDQSERRNAIAELENLSRQTDSFGRVVSNAAILDPNFRLHVLLLSKTSLAATKRGSRQRACLCANPEALPRESFILQGKTAGLRQAWC